MMQKNVADKQGNNRGTKMPRGRPWRKGQSGNPKGRPPKDLSLTSLIKEYLEQVPDIIGNDGEKNTKTWLELIALAWLTGAADGNQALLKELLDRLDGKPESKVRLTGGTIADLVKKESDDANDPS